MRASEDFTTLKLYNNNCSKDMNTLKDIFWMLIRNRMDL